MEKTVVIPVRHSIKKHWRESVSCETIFGIITGRLNDYQNKKSTADERIFVCGLLPDGVAIQHDIRLGECLVAIDKVPVDFSNIDAVLQSLSTSQKVALTLRTVCVPLFSKSTVPRQNEDLVKLIAGDRLQLASSTLSDCPHAAMYLTMDVDSERMQDKEDVIFCFPSPNGKLFDARGALTTLCHMMPQLCKGLIRNSTVAIDGCVVHIAYNSCGKELFLLCAPSDKLCISQINQTMLDVMRILKLEYGSFPKAFKNSENHRFLNQLFALTFQRLLLADELIERRAKQSRFVEPFFDVLRGVRTLVLLPETKVTIDNCLSDFEAADFAEMSDYNFGLRRKFTILGSCVFFKGYLLASHLPKEDLIDVAVYFRYRCMLTYCDEQQHGRLVLWREIFPTRRFAEAQVPPTLGYKEPEGRCFLMMVAMKNAVFAVELEAGGCSSSVKGLLEPDTFYVDQAKAVLTRLERLGIFSKCSSRVEGTTSFPSLACSDRFLPHGVIKKPRSPVFTFSQDFLALKSKKIVKSDSVFTKRGISPISQAMSDSNSGRPGLRRILSWNSGLSDNDGDYQTSVQNIEMLSADRRSAVYSNGESPSMDSSRLFEGARMHRNLPTMFDLAGLRKDLYDDEDVASLKLTSGCENTLFHYVHFDQLDGIFICPTQQELTRVQSPLTDHILNSFHAACISIHDMFRRSETPACVERRCRVKEHGVLFSCPVPDWKDAKKPAPTLNYWVVGRRFGDRPPDVQEFYACFHDSAQQNMVELAFKLVRGTRMLV